MAPSKRWLKTAAEIFDRDATAWFAQPLFELGWIKERPPFVCD